MLIIRPTVVIAEISPYPTVEIVWITHHIVFIRVENLPETSLQLTGDVRSARCNAKEQVKMRMNIKRPKN